MQLCYIAVMQAVERVAAVKFPQSDSNVLNRVMRIMIRVLFFFLARRMRLCTAVTEFEVERAKNQFKTQLLERLQSSTAASEDIAK